MKIISKWKDYYDYLSGIYGIDELMVYDRRGLFSKHDTATDWRYVEHKFAICNNLYTMFEYKGEFYHTYEEILQLDRLLREDRKQTVLGYYRDDTPDHWSREESWWKKHNCPINVNKKFRQPLLHSTRYSSEFNDGVIPMLSSYNFHKVLSAEEIYQQIYAFISWMKDHPEIPNKQTDLEKLDSHGFDRRKSFRHRK